MTRRAVFVVVIVAAVWACEPTVRVEAPKDPIRIQLDIKLDADVRVRLEDGAREDVRKNPGIF